MGRLLGLCEPSPRTASCCTRSRSDLTTAPWGTPPLQRRKSCDALTLWKRARPTSASTSLEAKPTSPERGTGRGSCKPYLRAGRLQHLEDARELHDRDLHARRGHLGELQPHHEEV